MKKIENISEDKIVQVYCNCCGKSILVENGMLKEGVFSTSYQWGYFSEKDGTTHRFDLCEDCYDKIISKFIIPVEQEEEVELI
jgi:hypothetical protein